MKENIKYIFKNIRSYLQNKNSSYDLGISSLGSAGYIYGITINY